MSAGGLLRAPGSHLPAVPHICACRQAWGLPGCRRQERAARAARSQRRPVRQPLAASAAPAADTSSSEAAELVQQFSMAHEVADGWLTIRPVQPEDLGPASVLLTRAFATSLQGVPLQDGRAYVQECLRKAPLGVLLVARLQPHDPSLLPPGQSSRVVATCGLSFCRSTREEFPTLQPPDDAAYLSNMAVDVKLRRRGHARLMLAAAESLVASAGHAAVYLHARLGDDPALRLYQGAGYREVQRDSLLAKLRGITPRCLMVKELRR